MKTIGITTEYNPFHNGHLYIARKAKEEWGADCVIALMSGDFTQRGEAAISDKWTRAKTAVASSGGAIDIVFELPFAFACNRASYFAKGSVDMLVRLGVDSIAFGCETDNPDEIRQLALNLEAKQDILRQMTAVNMKKGVSYAKAYETAVGEVFEKKDTYLLSTPNNILAIEYLKRISYWRKQGKIISDIPIKRVGSGYREVGKDYAGASRIREMILRGEDISQYAPPSYFEDYVSLEKRYLQILKSIILRSSVNEISSIYCIGEGFENKIAKEIISSESLEEYLNSLISKRYSAATVKRMLTYIFMGVKGETMDDLTNHAPSCCRLLATGNRGRSFMRSYHSHDFKIITNVNKIDIDNSQEEYRHLLMDIHAADMYNLLCGKDIYMCSDRVMQPYIHKNERDYSSLD